MLKRVQIEDFRCLGDVVLDGIGSLVALVGRNGVGKTSILDAIRWAVSFGDTPEHQSRGIAVTSDQISTVTIDFSAAGNEYRYRVAGGLEMYRPRPLLHVEERLWVQGSADVGALLFERTQEVVTVADGSRVGIGLSAPALSGLLSLLPSSHELVPHLSAVCDFFRRVRYYPPTEEHDFVPSFVRAKKVDEWRLGPSRFIVDADSVFMRLIELKLHRADVFEKLVAYVGPNDLELIDNIDVRDFNLGGNEDTLFYCTFKVLPTGKYVQYNELSFGTRRVLRLLTAALADDCAVMLMEQPEDGIHSALMKKLMDILREIADPTQIVIASHSSDVFNRLKPEEIRLVSVQDGATSVRSLETNELTAATEYMRNMGELAEFLEMVAD